ncbi:reverse transcriptase domain-containing protein [Tanacetum coccineum]|uniref:RNA-directed DNA polymerase n=1 Tax=Tanacetum coccineum TaxID=301880 RepID=A0ABQ4XUQ8_9ASTR
MSELNDNDQDSLNVAAGGNLLSKTTREALNIIENKSKVRYSLEIVSKKVVTPATVKAVEESCVTCGSAHAYYNCPNTDNNQSSVCAATSAYNQVASPIRVSNHMAPPGFASVQNNGQNRDCEDVFVKVGKFHFPTDFVVVDFEADPRVPLILGRSFLRTGRALIDVYGEEITLRVNDEAVTFNLDQTTRYSSTYDDMSINRIDVIDVACEEYSQEVLYPQDQGENGTFTCPYGTLLYCRMPLECCNVSGHKISKSGIEVDREKVDVIAKLPHPTTVKGVRSFLGHAGFYRRFIQDFSKIARPMTHLLKKETPFVFSKDCIDAFETLKKKLTEAPILVVPDWNLPFELMCDASDFTIGAVLGQRKTKHFQPIHYAIKTMTEAQIHYTTTEKEMLAIVYAFENFRPYLILSKSIVYTDHSALKYLLSKQDAKSRLLRWVLLLQEFDIIIRDKKGSENLAADHLSRL